MTVAIQPLLDSRTGSPFYNFPETTGEIYAIDEIQARKILYSLGERDAIPQYGVPLNQTEPDIGRTACRRLGKAVVFDAEAEGAGHGLVRATRITTDDTTIQACLDNTSVIQGLTGMPSASLQAAFIQFQKVAAATRGVVHVR
ncbi:hypothetical protein GQ53DRAFT_818088 [Thozetella sp. PMI_491]|nr:hypothetical protein GQ53DRAFT_818088 [Thozetella sp. PMI_491]